VLTLAKGFQEMQTEFNELVKTIKHYNEAIAVLYWDLRTGAPKKGVPERAEVIGSFENKYNKLVYMENSLGSSRIISSLEGDLLPRIC
jgi:carboxypeptidase Taq